VNSGALIRASAAVISNMESAFSGRGARVGALAFTDIQHLKTHLLCNIEFSAYLIFYQMKE